MQVNGNDDHSSNPHDDIASSLENLSTIDSEFLYDEICRDADLWEALNGLDNTHEKTTMNTTDSVHNLTNLAMAILESAPKKEPKTSIEIANLDEIIWVSVNVPYLPFKLSSNGSLYVYPVPELTQDFQDVIKTLAAKCHTLNENCKPRCLFTVKNQQIHLTVDDFLEQIAIPGQTLIKLKSDNSKSESNSIEDEKRVEPVDRSKLILIDQACEEIQKNNFPSSISYGRRHPHLVFSKQEEFYSCTPHRNPTDLAREMNTDFNIQIERPIFLPSGDNKQLLLLMDKFKEIMRLCDKDFAFREQIGKKFKFEFEVLHPIIDINKEDTNVNNYKNSTTQIPTSKEGMFGRRKRRQRKPENRYIPPHNPLDILLLYPSSTTKRQKKL